MGRVRGGPKKMRRWIRQVMTGKGNGGARLTVPKWSATIHQKTHFQLVDGLVADTPVGNPDLWKNPPPKGYSGGRAKGAWQSSIAAPMAGETGRIDPNGRTTIGANNRAVTRKKLERVPLSYITNNVPYINRLNQSPQWSKQQTPGWHERNIQRVKRQFD